MRLGAAALGLGALALGTGALVLGRLRWRHRTAGLVRRLRAEAVGRAPDLEWAAASSAALATLPACVARYLQAVVPDPPPALVYARLEQQGEFLLRPADPGGWRPFVALEHFTTRPAGFVWDARI